MAILTQRPDPNPEVPRFKCPPGTVDTHIHLFRAGDALSIRSEELLHPGGCAARDQYGAAGHARDCARRHRQRRRLRLQPHASCRYADALPRSVSRHRPGTRGYRPGRDRAPGAPRRARAAPVQRLARWGAADHLGGFAARAAEHGWHVQFYPHGANISDFADRLLAVVEHAPERLVWGSDWPHVNMDGRAMPNDGDLVDLIPEWILEEGARRMILVDNPCRLYGFPQPT